MAEEGFIVADVITTIEHGEVIETYPQARPFPAQLSFARVAGPAVHVAWATNPVSNKVMVITAYVPDPNRWEPDFRTRRK
jgi:hypothetical protein